MCVCVPLPIRWNRSGRRSGAKLLLSGRCRESAGLYSFESGTQTCEALKSIENDSLGVSWKRPCSFDWYTIVLKGHEALLRAARSESVAISYPMVRLESAARPESAAVSYPGLYKRLRQAAAHCERWHKNVPDPARRVPGRRSSRRVRSMTSALLVYGSRFSDWSSALTSSMPYSSRQAAVGQPFS